MRKGATYVIPWDNIINIYVAQQRGRNISEAYLAIQLLNTEPLDQNQTSLQNTLDRLNVAVQGQMSDKSGGDVYISLRMLGTSAETILDEINRFRLQHHV